MPGSFEQMEVYQQAREFRKRVWKLTRLLPPEERFVLVPQMKRASLSVTNNIAEGHGCGTWKHNISYLRRSRGSVSELLDDINCCEDESYFEKAHLDDLRQHASRVMRLINGCVRHLVQRIRNEANGAGRSEATE